MIRKILSIIVAASVMLVAIPITLTAAAVYDTSHVIYEDIPSLRTSIPFNLCESTTGFYHYTNASYELDRKSPLGGMSCISYTMGQTPENFIYAVYDAKDKAVDATGFTHLEMDIYLEDASFVSDLYYAQLELSSAGECDVEEVCFDLFKGFKKGWNHISFPIAHGRFNSATEKSFDISHVNYMRIQGVTNNPFTSIKIKLDNIYFTRGNGGDMPNQPIMMGESTIGVYAENNSTISLDTANKIAGNSSLNIHVGENANRLVLFQYIPAEPIDASGLTHLEMDICLEDDSFLSYVTASQFELSSGGTSDVSEVAFNIISKLKKGWTHIVLPLNSGMFSSSNGNGFDISHLNFIRFYAFLSPNLSNMDVNLHFDNISLTHGNGVSVYRLKNGNYKNNYVADSVIDYGNLDEDSKIGVTDALLALQYGVDKITFTNAQINKADVDNDKTVSASDALLILQYSVDKISEFKAQTDMAAYSESPKDLGYAIPRLIHTKYYTDQAVVADSDVTAFGAYGDGVHDDYWPFQLALDLAEIKGGGTIFVPVGTYKISRALRIPKGVTLKGDSPIITDGNAKNAQGTVLYAYSGRGLQDDENFLQMEIGAGVQNLSIYYPKQDPNNIVPYSYTIKQKGHYGISVNNVNLVNSYNGIAMGHNQNALQNIVNLTGCILNNGILLDQNVDLCRMENIHFSTEYWTESGLVNFSNSTKENIKNYTRNNAVGLKLQHIDWVYLNDVYVDDMNIGIRFMQSEKGEGYNGGPNGHVYNFNLVNCVYGVRVDYVNAIGMMFTKGYVKAQTPFGFDAGFANSATINSTTFVTTGNYGLQSAGNGDITLDQCTFINENTSSTSTAISLTNGSFSATNSTSKNYTYDVSLSNSARESKVINFNTSSTLKKQDNVSRLSAVWNEDYTTPGYIEKDYNQQLITRPSSTNFIDITTYIYSGDTSKGVAGKLQSAIDTLHANGGGIVYFPSGIYTLESNVVVKEGVEIRGSAANSPHHSHVPSTVFYTAYGRYGIGEDAKAQPAPALFTLKSRAGLSGFKILHLGQFTNSQFYPYAYTIRGDGEAIYVNNVTDCNPYYGIDLFTNKCDGHAINGYNGAPIKNGIVVGGKSANGVIKNCQLICHYYFDNPFIGLNDPTLTDSLVAYQKENLECYVIKDTVDEILFNNFSFGTRSGTVIDEGADAFVLAQGADSSTYPLLARGSSKGGKVEMINTQLVILGSVSDREYIRIENTFDGNLTLIQTNMWGTPANGVSIKGGNVVLNQGTILQAGSVGVRVTENANLRMSGICSRQTDTSVDLQFNRSTSSVAFFGNRYSNGYAKCNIDGNSFTTTDF
ncbi:MAG: hypothetical protein IJ944_04445 [Clostridia bacterium]|nr:hypothetical protein [Clostridia bacterium]